MADSTLTNSSFKARDGSPLPEVSRFACLPGCGRCCSYRVLVTEADRQRLQVALGDSKPWETGADGQSALRRTANFCLFVDSQQRCSVYEHRPDHCRAYPYLWVTYDRAELDVDFSCPGLGYGEEISVEQLKPPTESSNRQIRRAETLQQIRELLVAQRRYAPRKWLFEWGKSHLDALTTTWHDLAPTGAWTIRVEQPQQALIHVETKGTLEALQQKLRLSRQSAQALLADAAWMERHFAQSRWNTRLHPTGEVDVYRYWIAGGVLHLEDRQGTHNATSLTDIGQFPWESEALATRQAYLKYWLKRSLIRRLAINLAVAALIPGRHMAVTYLQLWLDIDHRLAVLAPALAQVGGKDVVDHAFVLEAIRGSDGLLRAWCESARVGTTS